MSESFEDEQYEPSVVAAAQRQQMIDELIKQLSQDIGLRIQIADIATRIPFNPTEPVDDNKVVARCETMFNWVTNFSVDTDSE